MKKIYNSNMPIETADDNILRLGSYGFAYKELQTKYDNLIIISVTEQFWDNTQNETRNLDLIVEYRKECEIN